MQSIQKHQSKPLSIVASKYFLTQVRDMNLSLIISKCLLVICLLSITALLCLSAASSKKSINDKLQNYPARYSRGYGYHGNKGSTRQKDRKGRQRQDLSLPQFQVHLNSLWLSLNSEKYN